MPPGVTDLVVERKELEEERLFPRASAEVGRDGAHEIVLARTQRVAQGGERLAATTAIGLRPREGGALRVEKTAQLGGYVGRGTCPAQCGPGDAAERSAPRTISSRSSVHPVAW